MPGQLFERVSDLLVAAVVQIQSVDVVDDDEFGAAFAHHVAHAAEEGFVVRVSGVRECVEVGDLGDHGLGRRVRRHRDVGSWDQASAHGVAGALSSCSLECPAELLNRGGLPETRSAGDDHPGLAGVWGAVVSHRVADRDRDLPQCWGRDSGAECHVPFAGDVE